MDEEKVTIGMPVFNDIKFIEKSILSILNQSYSNFTLIISDDCSTDGCYSICEKYAKQDKRINLIRQKKNIGISKNMMFLLSVADTPYFMWAADDDLWHPDFIRNLVTLLNENPRCVSAFCDFHHINENDEIISEKLSYDYEGETAYYRLKKFINNPFDAFGYGLFRTEKIKKVRFPVWLWPNNKISWNNIYPTLCYYLALGDYKHFKGEALFFNRVKLKVNHSKTEKRNVLSFLRFIIRKINLTLVSLMNITKAHSFGLAFRLNFRLIKKWVIVPVYYEFLNLFNQQSKN